MKRSIAMLLCMITVFALTAPTVLATDVKMETGVIFYHGNSYGNMDPVSVSGDYTLPECGFVHYDNYSFKCWRVYGQEMQPGDTIYVDEIITVDAVWQLNYYPASDDPRAIFDSNGGSGTMDTIYMAGGNLRLPRCDFTPPEGNQFKCWRVDGVNLQPDDTTYMSGNKTITAIWEPIPPRVYFENGGGTGSMEKVEITGEYTLPECDFIAPDGQQFSCWLVDGQQMQPGESLYVDGVKTATAVWETIPARITFENGGGTGTMEVVEIYGDYALPECGFTAPDGQQFSCWLVDGQQMQPGESIYADNNKTVTALWEEINSTGSTDLQTNNAGITESGKILVIAGIAFGILCAVVTVIALIVIFVLTSKKKKK